MRYYHIIILYKCFEIRERFSDGEKFERRVRELRKEKAIQIVTYSGLGCSTERKRFE